MNASSLRAAASGKDCAPAPLAGRFWAAFEIHRQASEMRTAKVSHDD